MSRRFGRKTNPETALTNEIRFLLRLLKIPHFKHWGGPMSEPGVPDIVGVLPGTGRALYIEVKAGRGKLRPAQAEFLRVAKTACALAFEARSLEAVVLELVRAGFKPAKRVITSGVAETIS